MAVPGEQRDHPGLLARLVEVVRPQFRGEVFHPPRDSKVFFHGECVVPGCPTMISHTARGLCTGHYQRWLQEQKLLPGVGFEVWLLSEAERTRRRHAPPVGCAADGCLRGVRSHGLCHRHVEAWTRAGRPDLLDWVLGTSYRPVPGRVERACCFPPSCPRWTDGPSMPLCRPHHQRWRARGRPDLQVWFAELAHGEDPRVQVGRLGRQVRLEVQFGIQCRYDEATKRTAVRTLTQAVGMIDRAQAAGLVSLLDWPEEQWRAFTADRRGQFASCAIRFIIDTRLRLHMLLVADDPWADQYWRDCWDLRVLGIQHEATRYLRFAGIPQPWLRELARRWIRWRLAQDIGPATLAMNLNALTRFAGFLGDAAGPSDLDRPRIEAWLALLRVQVPDPDTRRVSVSALAVFLRDVHRHGWEPALPSTAFCFEDCPPRKPSKPRWIPEEVMAQLEAPDNLARFPSADGRLILQILINCGLRLKDARRLPLDCVVRDQAGAPYLAWVNHKMRGRIAFFPITQTLAAAISDQQQRVGERFPAGSPWLFAAQQANLDGSRPATSTWWRDQLDRWLHTIALVHQGNATRVTAHQFRHTVATRLINANVPQHVVQQLLDHMSPQMTAVYARLLDKTVREHWEQATKVNADGELVEPADDHPLAGAAWIRLSMLRAKVTLPNGYCGAPIQTDCEYANPCLDCRFFITTADFLDQHERQRDETARLIADAQACGQTRIVQKNTRTLIKLETLIATLKKPPAPLTAAGPKDRDATG